VEVEELVALLPLIAVIVTLEQTASVTLLDIIKSGSKRIFG
jgi:hypothetical protein